MAGPNPAEARPAASRPRRSTSFPTIAALAGARLPDRPHRRQGHPPLALRRARGPQPARRSVFPLRQRPAPGDAVGALETALPAHGEDHDRPGRWQGWHPGQVRNARRGPGALRPGGRHRRGRPIWRPGDPRSVSPDGGEGRALPERNLATACETAAAGASVRRTALRNRKRLSSSLCDLPKTLSLTPQLLTRSCPASSAAWQRELANRRRLPEVFLQERADSRRSGYELGRRA